jgi:hypothetical protein
MSVAFEGRGGISLGLPLLLISPCSEVCTTDAMKGIGGTKTEGDNDGSYSAIG